jgi:uncharacterized protein YkvS
VIQNFEAKMSVAYFTEIMEFFGGFTGTVSISGEPNVVVIN